VQALLALDPNQRPSIDQVLECPLFRNQQSSLANTSEITFTIENTSISQMDHNQTFHNETNLTLNQTPTNQSRLFIFDE
jgi:hypothetical protein